MITVYVQFPEPYGVEEIDVQADDEFEASEKATEILKRDYMPGWVIIGHGTPSCGMVVF